MKVTRKSPISGKENTLEINVSQAQLDAWQGGILIQIAMPQLDAGLREFIKTGLLPDEFDKLFGKNKKLKKKVRKENLIDEIIADLKNNEFESREYIYDLVREALSERTFSELKQINI